MRTNQGSSRREGDLRGPTDSGRLIQLIAIGFTLAVALACTGKGSSGSSGHKSKKDRDPPDFAATLATDTPAASDTVEEPSRSSLQPGPRRR
jgi:hypothetical protein